MVVTVKFCTYSVKKQWAEMRQPAAENKQIDIQHLIDVE